MFTTNYFCEHFINCQPAYYALQNCYCYHILLEEIAVLVTVQGAYWMVDPNATDEPTPQRLKPKLKTSDRVSYYPFYLFTTCVIKYAVRWLVKSYQCPTAANLLTGVIIVNSSQCWHLRGDIKEVTPCPSGIQWWMKKGRGHITCWGLVGWYDMIRCI